MDALLLSLLFLGTDPLCAFPPPPIPLTDSLGDPLPEGVLHRLGRTRFVNAHGASGLVLSPDGSFLVSMVRHYGLDFEAPQPSRIHVWDAHTGKVRLEWEVPGEEPRDLALSSDGKTLALAQSTLSLWDVRTGKRLRHYEVVRDCSRVWFSVDGKELIAKRYNEALHGLDIRTGKETFRWDPPVKENALQIEVGPDGRAAWTEWTPGKEADGRRDEGMVSVWCVFPRKGEVARKLVSLPGDRCHVAFSPCGQFLAACRRHRSEYTRHLIRLSSGETVWDTKGGGQFLFAPDGRLFLTGGKELREIDMATGQLSERVMSLPVERHTWCWTTNGELLACTEAQGIRLWDHKKRAEVLACGSPGPACRLAFLEDGRLLTLSRWNQLSAWDVQSGRCVFSRPLAHEPRDAWDRKRDTLVWDFTRRRTVINDADGIRWLDLLTDQPPTRLPGVAPEKEDTNCITTESEKIYGRREDCGVFSPDGKTLYLESKEGTCNVFDCSSGKLLRTIPWDKSKVRFAQTVISPDGRFAVGWDGDRGFDHTGDGRSKLTLLDLSSGKELKSWQPFADVRFSGSSRLVSSERSLCFSGDSRLLFAIPGKEGNYVETPVAVWDIPSGEPVSEFVLSRSSGGADISFPHAFAVSPDGRTAAFSFARDPRIYLFEIASGTRKARLSGHIGVASQLAFSPDGKVLASSSYDGTVLLWDLTHAWNKRGPVRAEYGAEELLALWNDLADSAAETADAARGSLAAAPKQALAFLRTRLRPAPYFAQERVKRLLGDLGSETYPVRAKAQAELEALHESVAPLLREELKNTEIPLERRRRIERVLEKVSSRKITPERLRHGRVLNFLEGIGSMEARQLVRDLAGGHPDAQLTQEAQASLRRMKTE